jgi:hypothetical protein
VNNPAFYSKENAGQNIFRATIPDCQIEDSANLIVSILFFSSPCAPAKLLDLRFIYWFLKQKK